MAGAVDGRDGMIFFRRVFSFTETILGTNPPGGAIRVWLGPVKAGVAPSVAGGIGAVVTRVLISRRRDLIPYFPVAVAAAAAVGCVV